MSRDPPGPHRRPAAGRGGAGLTPLPPLTAAAVAGAVAALAWGLRTLTGTGALAAWVVGTLTLFGTGWSGGGVLAAFFVSGSLVSRLEPAEPVGDAKGNRRDHAQVLANGGVAAAAALLGPAAPTLALWIVTGALAAAAADTWATSVGTRSRATPRLLLGGRPVPRGTSGGVTLAGCAGAAAGALVVGAAGALAGGGAMLLPASALIGFLGMVMDSALGAGLQGRFHCPVCRVGSEWPVHRCGAATSHQGGLAWLDNDRVNFAATLTAGLLAALAWRWLAR